MPKYRALVKVPGRYEIAPGKRVMLVPGGIIELDEPVNSPILAPERPAVRKRVKPTPIQREAPAVLDDEESET